MKRNSQTISRRKYFYFSGAIRGDTSFERYFHKIIQIINEYGEALTERSDLYYPLDKNLDQKMRSSNEKKIFRRDIIQWLGKSSALIAEISGASTGVGYEIHHAMRDRRIPVFCLYHVSSTPTLVVMQDPSKYVITQRYSDENDLEKYLRSFLMILARTEYIEDIRSVYVKMAKEITKPNLTINEMEEMIKKLLTFGEPTILQKDLTSIHITKLRPVKIDFKDAASFVQFMFRNIVLQKRWEKLKTQRIGTTFVGGRKSRIITTLSNFWGPTNLLNIYRHVGAEKLGYTREAFTKNIRAYRRIGLFEAPIKAEYKKSRLSATKFKDRLVLVKTLQGDILVESSRSPREIMSKLIIVTRHLQHLSEFLHIFGSRSLVRLLSESREQPWYSKIPEIAILNVDKIDMGQLEVGLVEEIARYLQSKCKEFWKKHYSSFI